VGSTVTRNRSDLAERPIAETITTRGRELSADDTVATARRLFANRNVRVLPVLEGTTYLGSVERGSIDGVSDQAPVLLFAAGVVPTALATTPAAEALAELDRTGATRLVVLDGDGAGYVGLVCLRSDRERLCVDAEREAARELGESIV
jgi:CBS domain-containing protein